MLHPLTDEERDRSILCMNRLERFVEEFFPEIDPHPYATNWHIGLLSECLEAVELGQIRWLLINMPPRHMKSLVLSVMYPAWVWAKKPWDRFIFGTHSADLSLALAQKSRDVIQSEKYQRWYGHIYQLRDDANSKKAFHTTERGFRFSTSVKSKITGHGGDKVIIDDPHDTQFAESDIDREATVRWYQRTMHSRVESHKTSVRIVCGQRTHPFDVSGALIELGSYFHLELQARYRRAKHFVVHINNKRWEDPRTEEGAPLFPSLIDDAALDAEAANMSERDFECQYQQNPLPPESAMFDPSQWSTVEPSAVPDDCDWVSFYDLAATKVEKGKRPDFTVRALVGRSRRTGHFYLSNIFRVQDSPKKILRHMRKLAHRDGYAVPIHIEQEPGAEAKFAIDAIAEKLEGFQVYGHPSTGDKAFRAKPVAVDAEHGRWHIVSDAGLSTAHKWVKAFLSELALFPEGQNDDQVDAVTGAAKILTQKQTKVVMYWSTDHHFLRTGETIKHFGPASRGKDGRFLPPPRWNTVIGIGYDDRATTPGAAIVASVPPKGDPMGDCILVHREIELAAGLAPHDLLATIDRATAEYAASVKMRVAPPTALKLQEAISRSYGKTLYTWDKDVRAGLAPLRDYCRVEWGRPHPVFGNLAGRPRLYMVVHDAQLRRYWNHEGLLELRQGLDEYYQAEQTKRGDVQALRLPAIQALIGLASVWFVHQEGLTRADEIELLMPEGLRATDTPTENPGYDWHSARRFHQEEIESRLDDEDATDLTMSRRDRHPR
jgi:predicted phage terminase large subunit-like protein